jgi:small subunit ribosomal protein S1
VQGTVCRLSDFGAFVQVFEGVEGLAHISQLTWEKRVQHPREVVHIGDAVTAHILGFDLAERKLSLSIKGPMPEGLATKLSSKSKDVGLTDLERAEVNEWQKFQDVQRKNASAAGGSSFAEAFANARKKRS